jgi:hypothetical protein
MKRVLLLVMFFVRVASVYGQGTPSEGKDYYLGLIYPSYNTVVPATAAGFFRVFALVSSFQDNTAYVSYFQDNGVEEAAQPYKIQARKTVQIPLMISKLRASSDQTKEYKALHITAKKPINVQFFTTGGCSGGMYLALPTNGLGTKYTIASYRDNPELLGAYTGNRGPSIADSSRGIYQIIGTYDGTTVTITNSIATSIGTPEKESFAIMLNRGQCYTVRSRNHQAADDISGSIIESDRPIAVIAGHENAYMGGVDNKTVEQRDLMIEQMIPYDYLDNTGYIVIPMRDGTGGTDGKGDNVRINLLKDTINVTPYILTSGSPNTTSTQLKTHGTLQYSNVEYPSTFSAEKPISVMQYDMANHGVSAPFARPSMMTIVPRSRWRNAYLWSVPSFQGMNSDRSYITVIAPKTKSDSIYISKGGLKDVLIGQAGLSIAAVYNTIPNHPDLKATIYRLTTNSYYARANFPFMMYQYGNYSFDPDGDLGNFDGDDYYFSYATPLGMVLGHSDSTQMTIKVDTLCTGWRICATDMHVDGGIKSAFIADDPIGDIYPFDPKHGPYQYYNTSFTPDLDPNATREIIFEGVDTTECFDVTIDNIGKDGYAPIIITDKSGNGKMIELYYKKAAVAYAPSPDEMTNFGIQYIFDAKDSTFEFINQPSSTKPYIIEKIELLKKDPAFQILSYTPNKAIPFTLSPGDTFTVKVRFTYSDTGHFSDSLVLKTNCFSTYWPIEGTVGTGLITVSNHNFDHVVVGSTACNDTIKIHNVGNMPFTLTPGYMLFDSVDFSFDGKVVTSSNRVQNLPKTIEPGDWVKLRICFTPHSEGADSTDLLLKTDIRSPYEHSIKDVIHLKGKAIKPGVHWDITSDYLLADSTVPTIHRRYLVNSSTALITVNNIYIDGPDAQEFKIIGMKTPLEIALDTNSSAWIDFSFTPDMSKPVNYIRHAQLIATNTYYPAEPDTLKLAAGFGPLKVQQELRLEELRIHPNPTLGEDITVSFGLIEEKQLRFIIYDILGREVLSVPSSYFAKGKQSVTLPVSKLGEGGYILRVSDGILTKGMSFRVAK